ncbi:cysteine desulfurase family protein [Demequina sp.]|uniref:cysteine desulfurase family protein n=1 Tax=Demequina sp. TaxID=2050685 RepID=UPI003D0E5FF3
MSAPRTYLDAGGSAPLSQRTREALLAGLADGWADPARLSSEARRARALLEGSREAIADALGAQPAGVHFTASAVLGLERVLAGIWTARRGRDEVLVSAVERDATMHAASFASDKTPREVPVDSLGHVDLAALEEALGEPSVALTAIQHANHELGTVQDLDAVHALTSARGVPLVVDATSSIGHIAAPEAWDALVGNPADWGGPSGLGVVALRPSTRWLPAWPEGDDWAPGGVSVPLALAAAVALQERLENADSEATRLAWLVDMIRERMAAVPGVDVVGDPDKRLPHVVTFSCLYVDGEALLSRLDKKGFAVGSGSACTTSTLEPSRVLAAIGALTHGNVRVALHPGVSEPEIERFIEVSIRAIEELRRESGAPALG